MIITGGDCFRCTRGSVRAVSEIHWSDICWHVVCTKFFGVPIPKLPMDVVSPAFDLVVVQEHAGMVSGHPATSLDQVTEHRSILHPALSNNNALSNTLTEARLQQPSISTLKDRVFRPNQIKGPGSVACARIKLWGTKHAMPQKGRSLQCLSARSFHG